MKKWVLLTWMLLSSALMAMPGQFSFSVLVENDYYGKVSGTMATTLRVYDVEGSLLYEQEFPNQAYQEGITHFKVTDLENFAPETAHTMGIYVPKFEDEIIVDLSEVPFARHAHRAMFVNWAGVENQPSLNALTGTLTIDKIDGLEDAINNKNISETNDSGNTILKLENKSSNNNTGAELLFSREEDYEASINLVKNNQGITNLSFITDQDIIFANQDSEHYLSISKENTSIENNLNVSGVISGDGSSLSNVPYSSLTFTENDKIDFDLLEITKSDLTELGLSDQTLSSDDIADLMEDQGFLLSVSNENLSEAITFENLSISKTDITALGIPEEDSTLSNEQVIDIVDDSFVKSEDLSFGGSNYTSSGAYKIGVYDAFTHSDKVNLQEVLMELDEAISNANNYSDITDLQDFDSLLQSGGSSISTSGASYIKTYDSFTLTDSDNVQAVLTDIDSELSSSKSDIENNSSSISSNTSDISTNTTAINTNSTAIADNSSDISDNSDAIADNATEISNIQSNINGSSSSISSLEEFDTSLQSGGSSISNSGASIIKTYDSFTLTDSDNVQKVLTDFDTLLSTAQSDIDSNTADIATNKDDITTNKSNINSNTSNISSNTNSISSNSSDISTNTSAISSNTSDISDNSDSISSNSSNISSNSSSISSNSSNISTNSSNISDNDSDISSLQSFDSSLESGGSSASTSGASVVAVYDEFSNSNATNIQGALNDFDDEIESNTSLINTNKSNIESNSDDIDSNSTSIATNASSISDNSDDISTNGSNISSNSSSISSNSSDIATNASNISNNESNISDNTGNISTNTSSIATNAANISTNSGDIDSNSSDISSLETFDSSLESGGSSASTSGAAIVAVYDEFYNSNATNTQGALDDLDAAISSNSGDIASNSSSINTNASNISTNSNDINSLESDVDDLESFESSIKSGGSSSSTSGASVVAIYDEFSKSNSTSVQGVIDDLDDAIVINANSTASNASSIGTNASNISSNSSNISANSSDISSLESFESSVKSKGTSSTTSGAYLVKAYDEFSNSSSTTVQDVLDDLDAKLSSNSSSISTNSSDIDTNTSGISSNSSSISTNSSNISSNSSNISSNSSSISSNDSDISSLQSFDSSLKTSGTSASNSGGSVVKVYDEFANSNSTTVQDVLDDLDADISSNSSSIQSNSTAISSLGSMADQNANDVDITGGEIKATSVTVDDLTVSNLILDDGITQTSTAQLFPVKAFGNVNSSSTLLSGSYNVASTASAGNEETRVYFAQEMPNTNYSVFISQPRFFTNSSYSYAYKIVEKTTTYVEIYSTRSGDKYDFSFMILSL